MRHALSFYLLFALSTTLFSQVDSLNVTNQEDKMMTHNNSDTSYPKETVLIRIIETWVETDIAYKRVQSKMIISHSNGEIKEVELAQSGLENVNENTVLIHSTIHKYLTKGFVIVSSDSSGGDMGRDHIYILQK